MLNSKYFNTIHTESHNGNHYSVIRPLDNPMILFSEIDGSPLASVHLRCQYEGQALITKRPEKNSFPCDFQGIINKNGCDFELVITNLCKEGSIKIDFMKSDCLVREVDPGSKNGALNQVNELHPYQSYAIQCDQKDNCSLILNAIKKNSGDVLTVKEAEANMKSNSPEGTYYYVTVVPQLGKPELIEKFKKTKWACVDLFCLKSSYQYEPKYESLNELYRMNESLGDECFLIEPATYNTRGSQPIMHLASMNENVQSRSNNWTLSDNTSSNKSTMDSYKFDDLINNSAAATVSGGRKMEVRSGYTGIDYSYDTLGEHCCLGLSINEKVEFKSEPTDLNERAKELIADYLKSESKDFLQKLNKKYESTECVICLDGTNKIDTVFYTCGHSCCHKDCGKTLQKCPLCRNHITAALVV